ncbi:MAG: bifunctional pyr operon transcriptional regulator/uracil phosphoribosyltransferase PyrR [Erysipelothrix sp.]|nr:bifunctional pyr operon transcriptional regulator/uracil phosphoribosyltransferase PyrR [Erysipelothrix sp.]
MKVILNDNDIKRALTRITHEILENNNQISNLVLVGIKTRGVYLMQRIADNIKKFEDFEVDCIELEIDYWRDDYRKSDVKPEINYDFSNKKVVLIDDVLFGGRTIRAAMDGIISHGRPETIQLAVLVDRGHREFPIRADYVGKNIPTAKVERVSVSLMELDGIDKVELNR